MRKNSESGVLFNTCVVIFGGNFRSAAAGDSSSEVRVKLNLQPHCTHLFTCRMCRHN